MLGKPRVRWLGSLHHLGINIHLIIVLQHAICVLTLFVLPVCIVHAGADAAKYSRKLCPATLASTRLSAGVSHPKCNKASTGRRKAPTRVMYSAAEMPSRQIGAYVSDRSCCDRCMLRASRTRSRTAMTAESTFSNWQAIIVDFAGRVQYVTSWHIWKRCDSAASILNTVESHRRHQFGAGSTSRSSKSTYSRRHSSSF